VLEGDWQPPACVLRYPSFEQAKAFYDSPATARARLREGATECFNMVLVEGVDAPPPEPTPFLA
jgi:uncharacterized protein (DUF1330 family)